MALITVDEKKCKRDGICVAECPIKILRQAEPGALPEPVNGAEELCINCGHCVAVCPHGAMSQRAMKPEDCPEVKKEWLLGPEQVEHFLRNRRSIRVYKDKTVEKETLAKLVDTATYAPSGHNRQPVHWLVIQDTKELKGLTGIVVDWMRHMIKEQPALAAPMHLHMIVAGWEVGMDVICRDAPHLILAHGNKSDPTTPVSCTIALTYLELAAQPFGLGACWAGYFNLAATLWPPMQQALGLPPNHGSFGAMLVGYPKFKYHRLPLRNPARITWR